MTLSDVNGLTTPSSHGCHIRFQASFIMTSNPSFPVQRLIHLLNGPQPALRLLYPPDYFFFRFKALREVGYETKTT
jgi:hypothetical protein